MNHRALLVAAVTFGSVLSLPVGNTFAQEGPNRTGGLGTITTGVNAGPASQSSTGADGAVDGPAVDPNRIPGVGLRPASEPAAAPFPAPAITTGPALPVAGNIAPAPTTTDAGAGEGTTPVEITTDAATETGAGTVPVEITESSTSPGESVIGEAPVADEPVASDAAVTDDASGDAPREERRRDDATANSDGETTTLDGAAPAPAGDACGYPSWIDAQSALEKDATLADSLDPDGDGIACEEAMY